MYHSESALYDALRSNRTVECSKRELSFDRDIAIVVSVGLQLNPTLLSLNFRKRLKIDSNE
jgi:hypothetical protein